MPRKCKVFNLYDVTDYQRSMKTGEQIYSLGTTYAKTVRGALKTFMGNHAGRFVVEKEHKEAAVFYITEGHAGFAYTLPETVA